MWVFTEIERILAQDYDNLKRDGSGTIVYDKQLKQVAENLLTHDELHSEHYPTCDAFFNAILGAAKPLGTEFFTLPEGCKAEYRYVNSVLTKPIWTSWLPSNRVFISAGTGRGKNTFIKNELLKHIGSAKAVIFENRDSLMQQQITDIIAEVGPQHLKFMDLSNESEIYCGDSSNIMIISYQTAALKCLTEEKHFIQFCTEAKYLIFDEAHYILDDAPFNKGINFFVNTFLAPAAFPNAVKLFLSGCMEEFYAFTQRLYPFTNTPNNLHMEKEAFDKNPLAHQIGRSIEVSTSCVDVLSMPTDYSYIQPYRYQELMDICPLICESGCEEKWLAFVNSIEDGCALYAILKDKLGGSVRFLHSKNKNKKENEDTYYALIHTSRFDCRVLISTTVIYNGVNVIDPAVNHIVLPFTTVPIMKQLIGRKRMKEGECVNVYFQDVTKEFLHKRY